MSENELLHFRNILLEARRSILSRVAGLRDRRQQLSEPVIEMEEEAQKATITLPDDRLDETTRRTLDEIEAALGKITIGDYGICENCGNEISFKRLEALPWTRLCIECASERERKRGRIEPEDDTAEAGVEAGEESTLPDEYEGLSEDQILAAIHEQIASDGRLDLEEVDISIRNGVLYLEGTIAGEPKHQILMRQLTDVLGFSAVVDHLVVNEVVFEGEDRTPGKREQAPTLEERLFYDEEDLSEDLRDVGDEKPYHPPENPPPQDYGTEPEGEGSERTI